MEKPHFTQSETVINTAAFEKKPFVAPTLEKMDVALTESGTGSSDGSDFSTYQS